MAGLMQETEGVAFILRPGSPHFEEASQAGLIARIAHTLFRHRADKDLAISAVTPLRTTEITRAPHPGLSTGSNARFLRAPARDSGALRGEAAAPARDDGCLRPMACPAVGGDGDAAA